MSQSSASSSSVRAWDRLTAGGLTPGFPQVMWCFRAVSSVANCLVSSLVVRWFGNGLSGWLRLCGRRFNSHCVIGGAVVLVGGCWNF